MDMSRFELKNIWSKIVDTTENAGDINWQWPYNPPLIAQGDLPVSTKPPHKIHYWEFGNKNGEPVVVVHGGPGAGSSANYARYFDPAHYRIILFDQRGCGQSEPSVSTDPERGLAGNTTPDLVSDIEKIREKLNLGDKITLFGGSWGSTLSLAYAIEHPEHVENLVLRGIFLCRQKGLDYFYQGNAYDYDTSAPAISKDSEPAARETFLQNFRKQPTDAIGAYRAYSDRTDPKSIREGVIEPSLRAPGMEFAYAMAWDEFVRAIPNKEDRRDMVAAYGKIFDMKPTTDEERALQDRALVAWTRWEGIASNLDHDVSDLGKFEELLFARRFARIENTYFRNGAYLGGEGEQNRSQNWIIENLHKLAKNPDMKVRIVHGMQDQVCPAYEAPELYEGLRKAGVKDVELRMTTAGHSMMEKANAAILIDFMDELRGKVIDSTKALLERVFPGSPYTSGKGSGPGI